MENIFMNLYMLVTAFASFEMVEIRRDLKAEDCLEKVEVLNKHSMFPHTGTTLPTDERSKALLSQLIKNQPLYVCYISKLPPNISELQK